jgi:hypothetical protein
MPIFKVIEDQRVRYRWTVDADTAQETVKTATEGVPDDAVTQLLDSDVSSTQISSNVLPDMVLDRWEVACRITSAITSPPETLAEATVTVRALTHGAAYELALTWIEDNDHHVDDRLQPVITIDRVSPLEDQRGMPEPRLS